MIKIPEGLAPRLQAAEVIRIATEKARSRHFNVADYECDIVVFRGGLTNGSLSGKWSVHFATRPASPDLDFSVTIEDQSRKAQLRPR